MSDTITTILTLCGLGLAGCATLFVSIVVVLFVTGRWLMIPTVFAIVPQAFNYVFGKGGLIRGTNVPQRSRTSRYNEDSDGEFERNRERSASAADRIRARRDQFDGPPDRSLRPSRQAMPPNDGEPRPTSAAPDVGSPDDLTPDARPFEQGGQRGGISDRYQIRGPRRQSPGPDAGSIGNRPTRDSRKREWNEDEIFGGMFDE